MTKICPICGIEFEPDKPQRIYCSNDCYKTSLRIRYYKLYKPKEYEIKKCAYCGKEFQTKISTQIYCSYYCQYQVTKHRAALRHLPKRKNNI